MDPATIIGLLVAFGSLYAMITFEGAHVSALLLPGPLVLVFGATIAVGLAGSTLADTIAAFKALPLAFRGKIEKPQHIIDLMVALADTARKNGLLALDQEAAAVKEPFLRNALQNIADGTDGEELRMILEDQVITTSKVNRQAGRYFKALGGYAPTVGIIGTVVALTHVMEKLDQPETLGPSIAAAFVATLWGLLSANFIWLPIGDRLNRLAELETERMTLITEGVLAIQAGSQPRLLGERLGAMVPAPAPKAKQRASKAKQNASKANAPRNEAA